MNFTEQWLATLLQSMQDNIETATVDKILKNCSIHCTSYWATEADKIRKKFPNNTDTSLLLEEFKKILPGGGPEIKVDDAKIFWSFSGGDCPCPVGNIVKNPVICSCSIDHVRGMLEPLLGKKLNVEIIETRLRGGSKCAFKVDILK